MAYFAASTDDPKTNRKFAESLKLDYPILSDPDKKVGKAYGVLIPLIGLPRRWTFFIDREGILRHIEKSVDAAAHGAQVVKKLEELGVPQVGQGDEGKGDGSGEDRKDAEK